MSLSRTDLVPVLAIVAGGVIGASLSFSFLGQSPTNDVSSPDAVVVPSVTPELLVRVEHQGMVVTAGRIEFDGIVITPVVSSGEVLRSEEQKAVARARALTVGTLRRSSDLNGFPVIELNRER